MSLFPTQEFKTVLTASQLLTLNSQPVLLVPGKAGYVIELQSCYMRFLHGSTPFNPGEFDVIAIYFGTADANNVFAQSVIFSAVGIIDQAVDQACWNQSTWGGGVGAIFPPSYVGTGISITQWDDDGVNVFPGGADWTQGNGSLAVFLKYAYVEV